MLDIDPLMSDIDPFILGIDPLILDINPSMLDIDHLMLDIDPLMLDVGPSRSVSGVLMSALKDEYDKVYYDETAGVRLDPQPARDATQEELKFMRELKVYHEALDVYARTNDLQAIGARWVYTNKGDATRPNVRVHA